MKDIEAKLDQAATLLAELMLSQLGFSFIPKVRIEISYIFQIIPVLTEEETQEVPFYYYESLTNICEEDYHEPIYTFYQI